MASELHRMLYATDLSADSIAAIPYAIKLAYHHKAKLIIFHIIDQGSITFSNFFPMSFDSTHGSKTLQEKSKAALQRMQGQFKMTSKTKPNDHPEHLDTIAYLVVHYGKIAEEIVNKANQWGCEMIIFGPRRRKFLGRILCPSLARKVIRRTDTPVHIISLSRKEKT